MDKISKMKKSENETLLTEYTSILLKNIEEGVATNDLSQLQQDLKKLQWTMRTRFFQGEYFETKQIDAYPDRNNGYDDTPLLKRKRPDEVSICRDIENDLRIIKRDLGYNDKKEILALTLARDDKCPVAVEPYCVPVNKSNVPLLDALIQETARNGDRRMPEYTERFTNDEEHVSKSSRKASDLKGSGLHLMVESFGAVTQKLLSALIQDEPLHTHNKVAQGSKTAENGSTRASKMRNRHSLDRSLLKELVAQGILLPDDINKAVPEEETAAEGKKCHS